ncbi:hypothetical protein M9Y10_036053 [Tritrichomonas musculus]|uniref:Protein kinase domain-containing protein n=1 Tax=Tritrichomonas musculus TaxID=1915356 RepID=A0ABR2GWS0_9EUKA
MEGIFNLFLRKLKNESFQKQNRKLYAVIQNFSFDIFLDVEKDFKYLLEKNNDSHIIIIDKYIDNESENKYGEDFYIICFEYSLIIIRSEIISYFLPFFNKNKDSTIYCYSEKIKDELQQLTKDNIFQFSTSKFFTQISDFLSEFDIFERTKEVNDFWDTIRRSIVGFLLMKSYNNSKIDRTNPIQFDKLFHKNPEAFQLRKDEYIELKQLGNGSSSWVYLIYHIKHEKIYALKFFCSSDTSDNEKLYKRELYNYNNLNHPFIPRFFGTLQEGTDKCLVIEYIEGETLDKIKDMNIFTRVQMTINILRIIEHIHSNNFIHRDLKKNNFIVNNDGKIFLIDFDRMIYSKSTTETNDVTQDLLLTPPEIQFSLSSDIFFIGLNILKHLFPDEIYHKYPNLKKSQELTEKCINENPELRPNISELINNYYLIMGDLYSYGQGVKQDYNKAKEYYELSAQRNNSDAFINLGNLYANGYGVEQDYNKAIKYYELSAQRNNLDAFNNLGNLYKNGYGVKQDYNKAKEYYELSAQRNNSDAFIN